MTWSGGNLPSDAQRIIDAELAPGERLVWSAQPRAGRFALQTIPLVLFGIPWTVFALSWSGMAAWGTSRMAGTGGPGLFRLFPLFGLPFVLIGLGMLSSPWWAIRKARRSAYALTDRRAILCLAGWRGTVTIRSFEPAQLTDLRRKQRADGSGDLVFAVDWSQTDNNTRSTDVGFIAIPDVKEVEDLVRALVERARS